MARARDMPLLGDEVRNFELGRYWKQQTIMLINLKKCSVVIN